MKLSPDLYDASINWVARIRRERPVLKKVLGRPGRLPVLDAGCGTGRHAAALASSGYRVVGVDRSAEMLAFAAGSAGKSARRIEWVHADFSQVARKCPGPFAGIYCIGNSLSATGSAAKIQSALRNFAAVLSPSGKLFIQVLNYLPMRKAAPCVRGPVHFRHKGAEYLRVRLFDFAGARATVTSISLVREGGWRVNAIRGRLCVFDAAQLKRWCRQAGLRVLKTWGSYAGEPFDRRKSSDLIVIAKRAGRIK